MRPKELMVPFSVIEKLNEMHYQHLTECRRELSEHLERVAALYERALNPPAVSTVLDGPLWNSEEEEDEKYLIAKAERRALEEQQREAAFSEGDTNL